MTKKSGSSPLARGLLRCGEGLKVWNRIIPARAGFTMSWQSMTVTSGDHPRSRGVYSYPIFDEQYRDGSSPLARGLRLVHRQ